MIALKDQKRKQHNTSSRKHSSHLPHDARGTFSERKSEQISQADCASPPHDQYPLNRPSRASCQPWWFVMEFSQLAIYSDQNGMQSILKTYEFLNIPLFNGQHSQNNHLTTQNQFETAKTRRYPQTQNTFILINHA
jgi:hypothetical protein